QTMPAFVYLIPVVLFFGVARVPSMIATVIYALPPVIRLTSLGIRSVSEEALEAARSFGSTERQLLYKVQIPLAMPTIMAGVNQTIMMALGIVVIASLIGSGGLGDVVLKALRRLRVGQAFEAGLAIVFLAVLLDRLSYAFSQIEHSSYKRQGYRLLSEKWANVQLVRLFENGLDRLYEFLGWPVQRLEKTAVGPYAYWLVSLLILVILTAVGFAFSTAETARFGGTIWTGPLMNFPEAWRISISAPINTAVDWAQVNLYEIFTIGDVAFGIGPFSDFLTIYILRPLIFVLQDGLSWPVVMLLVAAGAYAVGEGKLMLTAVLSMVAIGLLGMWEHAMTTLAQVIVAVLLSVLLGVPLGIWSARSNTAERIIRPILDLLQTIPPFVYLVPVIMLFNIGSIPGIIASVLYAIPPVIRLTNLGIRQVDKSAVEAAESFGSTARQTLFKVQLPLALPSIMLGINQTVMMVLAMVIIAGLIGGAGLGFEVIAGFTNNRLGQSVEAGFAIVLMAIIIDRLTQAWAAKRKEAANL
ncbi:MAG: ABC transporter permease subunit, partial [Anaerolineales bacterium]|nr:ABC transporter permease subunit [Anaerolineales bacterium]